MKKVAYYITAHGYGHGTRSCDILRALRSAAPALPIVVKTDLPESFLASRLDDTFDIRRGAFDSGMIQTDAIKIDLEASLAAVEALYRHEEEWIDQEVRFIQDDHIGLVVADIPAIPLAAAHRVGIPNIATGNFGWDWIYSEFVARDSRWQIYVDKFRAVYAKTDVLLRQPFSEPMSAFPRQIDLPLLAMPGRNRREALAHATRADIHKKWILISFYALDLTTEALERLARHTDCEFFSVEPLEWKASCVHCISLSTARFADILASVDLVITKPGFGIISECIANHKPIIYSDRENFKEYPVLVESIKRFCRHAFIPNAELYAGELEQALESIATAPEPTEKISRGGAEFAAGEILKRLG